MAEIMKTLVTGGGGFIGSRLVRRLLERGHRVRVLDVQPGRLKHVDDPNLEFVGLGADPLRGGMLDRNLVRRAVRGVDVVYHFAINWDGRSWRGTLPIPELFNANIGGTWNLLEAAKSSGVKHILFSSSIAVYGNASIKTLVWRQFGKPARETLSRWRREKVGLVYMSMMLSRPSFRLP